MLEKQLAALLATNLGLFVRDLNEDQLRVSLWSGEVTLHNLVLQPDVLERITEMFLRAQPGTTSDTAPQSAAKNALLLPFIVVKGVIAELRLRIPWMSLDSEAVRVEVTGVDLVFAPLRAKPFSPEEESRRREVMKEAQLAEYETLRQSTSDTGSARKPVAETACEGVTHSPQTSSVEKEASASGSPGTGTAPTSPSFVQRLLEGVYRNVLVTTRHISIRYLMDYPGLAASLACGISLWIDEVSFAPTSPDFTRPTFLSSSSGADTAHAGARGDAPSPSLPHRASTASHDVECRAARLTNVKLAVHAHRLNDTASHAVPASRWSTIALTTFAQAWGHTEILVNCDELQLQVKQTAARGADSQAAAAFVDVVVSLGQHLRVDCSFGALALLKHVAQSMTDGFAGVSYRRFLPMLNPSLRTTANARLVARQRWAFALACVAQHVRRERRLDDYATHGLQQEQQQLPTGGQPGRLQRMVAFAQLRREYCDLWKRSRSFYWLPPLEPSEAARMRELESQSSLPQLVLLRAFAYAEIDVEHAQRMQQDAWIAEKTGAVRKLSAPHAVARKASTGAASNVLRWFGLGADEDDEDGDDGESHAPLSAADLLLQQRVSECGLYTFRDLTQCTEPLHFSFEAEWAIAKAFLDERHTARTPKAFSLTSLLHSAQPGETANGSRGTPVDVAVAAPRPSVCVRVVLNKLTAVVRPQCSVQLDETTSTLRHELFLQHVNQQLVVEMSGFELFFNASRELREDKARTSLYVKSFSAHFAGALNTPLILSRECSRSAGVDSGSISAAGGGEDFLIVKENATQTRLTVTMASFVVVARPLHELHWWSGDVMCLLSALTQTPVSGAVDPAERLPTFSTSLREGTGKPLPLVDCTIAPFAVVVPLFAHDLRFSDLMTVAPAYYSSSPTSVVGSLNSTNAPEEGGSYGSVDSLLGCAINPENLVLDGEPCFILSVPSGVRISTITEPQKRFRGADREFYLRVGDESKSVRLSCQTASARATGAARIGPAMGRLATTRRKDIFSFSMLEVIVNPEEIGIVLEMGVEATLDPLVAALVNDQLLRPDVLYGSVEQLTATASLWANVVDSHDTWNLTSPRELHMRDGATTFTLREADARHYLRLVAQHHGQSHPQWREGPQSTQCAAVATGKLSAREGGLSPVPPATPPRRISLTAGLLKLRLCDESGLELMEAELVNPQDEAAPAASAAYRDAFSFFGGGPRALEVLVEIRGAAKTLFVCAPDISVTTSLGASVATLSQLCVTVQEETDGAPLQITPSLHCLRLVVGKQCRSAIHVLSRVHHTLRLADVDAELTAALGRPPTRAAQGLSAPREVVREVHCELLADEASVLLPLSREPGMGGRALDVSLQSLRVSLKTLDEPSSTEGRAYRSRCEVEALLTEALRVDEDGSDRSDQVFTVLGPLERSVNDGQHDGCARGAKVFVRLLVPFAEGGPSTLAPPEIVVDVTDAHVCAYMPFVQHLFYSLKDPLYTELAGAWQSASKLGFLTGRLLVPSRTGGPHLSGSTADNDNDESTNGTAITPRDRHDANIVDHVSCERQSGDVAEAAKTVPVIPLLFVTLNNVELFLPTNNSEPVSVADDSTFFLLFAETLTIREKRVQDDRGVTRRRLLIESTSLRYHDGTLVGPLLPLSAHLTVTVEFGVLLVPKQSDTIATAFQYVAARPADNCVRVSVVPLATGPVDGAPQTTSAVVMTLHASRVVALVEMIQFNLSRPLFSPGVVPSRPPHASTVMVTTAPLEVVVRDHNERPAFRVQLKDGFQYYKAGGGQWDTCPSQRVFISGIQLDACTHHDAGGGGDAVGTLAYQRLVSSSAARLITEVSVNRLQLERSVTTVAEIDSIELLADNHRSWLALHDLLLEPCVEALAHAGSDGQLSRQQSNASLSSRNSGLVGPDRRELVTADVRLGVRNVAVRLGDGYRVAQLAVGVPQVLLALHVPPRSVSPSALIVDATVSPPSVQVYYHTGSHASWTDGPSSVPLRCATLLTWDDVSIAESDTPSLSQPPSAGIHVQCVLPRGGFSPAENEPQQTRLAVTVRRPRLTPHLEAYAQGVRLLRKELHDVRSLVSERAQLRDTFSSEGHCTPINVSNRAALAEVRFTVENMVVTWPCTDAATQTHARDPTLQRPVAAAPEPDTCWLELGRLELLVAGSDSGGGRDGGKDVKASVELDAARIAFTRFYAVRLPCTTVRWRRVPPSADGQQSSCLLCDVVVTGREQPEAEVCVSMKHLTVIASCLQEARALWPSLQAALDEARPPSSTRQPVDAPAAQKPWKLQVSIHPLHLALSGSEYTSGDHRLRLCFSDPVTVRLAPALVNESETMGLTLNVHVLGRCRLCNGDDETLAHRDATCLPNSSGDREGDDTLVTGQPAVHGIEETALPTFSLEAHFAHGTSPEVAIATAGIRVCATHQALTSVRQLSTAVRGELVRFLALLAADPAVSSSTDTAPSLTFPARVRLVVHSVAAEIGRDALAEVRDVVLEPIDVQRMMRAALQEQDGVVAASVSVIADSEPLLTVGAVFLRDRYSGVVHARVHRPSVVVRADHVVRVAVPRVLVSSDGSPFFVDLLHSVLVWQSFVRAEAAVLPDAGVSQPWLRGLVVDVEDIRLQCRYSVAEMDVQDDAAPSHVEIQISFLQMKRMPCNNTTEAARDSDGLWTTSVDARRCQVMLRGDRDRVRDETLPPVVEQFEMSVKIEPGWDEVSGALQRHLSVRTSPITVHLPMGELLTLCTESLAGAVLPVLRYVKSDAAYRAVHNRLPTTESVLLAVSHDAQGRIVSAVPQDAALVQLSSTIPSLAAGNTAATAPHSTDTNHTNFFRFSVYIPQLAVSFFDFADAHQAQRLFAGVALHEISAERSHGSHSSVRLFHVGRLSSRAARADLFTFRTVSEANRVAIQWRDEVLRFPSPQEANTLVEKHAHTLTVTDAEIAFSPAFLVLLNERCVGPLLTGVVSAVRASAQRDEDDVGRQCEGQRWSNGALSYRTYQEPLSVESDLLLQRDLVLGGPGGIQLRFAKSTQFGARNTLSVRSLNHARLILLPMPVTGDAPVLVDEGMTVVVESTPVVLVTAGGSAWRNDPPAALDMTLSAYVSLGPRSVFLVPDAALVRFDSHAPAASHTWRDCGAKSIDMLHRYHEMHLSVGVDVRLQAHNECVRSRVQVVGTYARETLTTPLPPDADKNVVRGVQLIAESGDFQTTHVWFACSDGPVTEQPDGAVLHIRRQGDKTVAHLLVAPMRFAISRNHLRLLWAAADQVAHGQRGLRASGLLSALADYAPDSPLQILGGAVVLGTKSNLTVNATTDGTGHKPADVTAGESATAAIDGSGAATTTVEVRVTVPQVELVLGDDFFTPLVSASLEAMTLVVTADRCFRSVAGIGAFAAKVNDYPWLSPSPARREPRALLAVSPEVTVQIDRFDGSGMSASVSVETGDVEATVPLTRLLRALKYPWEAEEAVQPLVFQNLLGAPLLLLAAVPTSAAAEGGSTNTAAPAFCFVPPGATQALPSLLRFGQTVLRIVHEPEPPSNANLFDRLSYLYALGAEVDLRQLSNGQTCRFVLEGSPTGVSTGTLDVVLRFDGSRRVISATSVVLVRNELQGRTVQWSPYPASETVPRSDTAETRRTDDAMPLLTSGEAAFIPLPLLQRPVSLSVDGRFTYQVSAADAVPLERLLAAWALSGVAGQRGNTAALRLPLWLTAPKEQEQATLGVELVVEKELAKTAVASGGLRKYELTCRVRPFATVVNLIGLSVTLTLMTASGNETKTDGGVMMRHVTLEHGAQFDWYPNSPSDIAQPPYFLLEIQIPASLTQRHDDDKVVVPPRNPVTLKSLDPIPLVDRADHECLVPLSQADPRSAAGDPLSICARRRSSGVVQLTPLATVENGLSVPIQVRFSSASTHSAVLGGTVAQVFPREQLPLFWPTKKTREYAKRVHVCIGAGSRCVNYSDPVLIHGAPNPLASTLSSADEIGGRHVFSAAVATAPATGTDYTAPVLSVHPLWKLWNAHPSLSLRVRTALKGSLQLADGTNDTDWPPHVEVEPLTEVPLSYFHAKGVYHRVEPCAALQYVLPSVPRERDTDTSVVQFAWTTPILLGELDTAASYVSIRHELTQTGGSGNTKSGPLLEPPPQPLDFTVFQDRCVPAFHGDVIHDTFFGCLSVSTRAGSGNHSTFHVQLARGSDPAPVQIENRTDYSIQCSHELLPPSTGSSGGRTTLVGTAPTSTVHAIVVAPFTDCALCWTDPFLGAPVLRLTAYHNHVAASGSGKRTHHTVTQDLRRLASANEPVSLGDSPLFVYVSSHRRDSRCFVVTIMDSRKLATQLLFFPRVVGHLELSVRSLSLFVASECVRADCPHLSETPLGTFAVRGLLPGVPPVASAAGPGTVAVPGRGETEEYVLDALKHRELDVFVLRLSNLGLTVVANEKRLLVALGVGGIAVQDCTSPSPQFPVVLSVEALPTTTAGSQLDTDTHELAFIVSAQLQWSHFAYKQSHAQTAARPSEVLLPRGYTGSAVVSVEEMSVAVGSTTVLIDDHFAVVCRDAFICATAAMHTNWLAGDGSHDNDEDQLSLLTSGGGSRTQAEAAALLWSHRGDRDEEDPMERTARQLLLTQRSLRARASHEAAAVECYVSFLHISALRMTLTLALCPQEQRWHLFSGPPFFGLELPTVDSAPLYLKERVIRDLFRRGDSVGQLLVEVLWSVYRGQVFEQACRVLGSLAMLGNPLALVEGWSRGVRMLFDDAVVNRQPLVGTRAFLRQVTSSTLHSVGLISGAGRSALLTLTAIPRAAAGMGSSALTDAEAASWLSGAAHAQPRRSSRFLRDLVHGVSGVVVQPLRGARHSGVPGFFAGVATGLVEAVTRPVAGALADVSGAAEVAARQLQPVQPSRTAGASAVSDASGRTATLTDYVALERNFVTPVDRSLSLSVSVTSASDETSRTFRFVSARVYQAAMDGASRKGLVQRDGARYVIDLVGAHNYALYATYKAFLQYTTSTEFSSWVGVALNAHLARELPQLLEKRATVTAASSHPSATVPDLERAYNIKATLGIPALLKHVSLAAVVEVCTLTELRTHVAPEDLQKKCGPLLAQQAVAQLAGLLGI